MAAGLLALLLVFPSRPARAAVARVEAAPVLTSIVGASMPLSHFSPAPLIAPGLASAPSLAAPLSAPAAAPAAFAVSPEEIDAPAAAASAGGPAAASSPGASHAVRARSVARKMDETASALEGEAARPAPDLLARDYAVYTREDIERASNAMLAANDTKYKRGIAEAVFSENRGLQEELIARVAQENSPRAWSGVLQTVYLSMRAAYLSEQGPGARAAVSSRLQDSAALFLARVADDAALPDAARNLARGIAARFLTNDRLLAGLAWGRSEKERVAAGRRELAAEVAALPGLAKRLKTSDVGTSSENRNWLPPPPDAAPPVKAGTGVWRQTADLNERSREFKDQFARFQLARGRWDASRKIRLSARAASREKRLWGRAAVRFERALSDHEHLVDYFLEATLKTNFSRLDGALGRPVATPDPGVSLRKTPEGYLLQATFETKIQDPAVIAAFRRSIEMYWSRGFTEKGRRRRLTTQITVRVLGPEEEYAAGSLRLVDGGSRSKANGGTIFLSREFRFHTSAHEFGHIMGLPDEYVNRYSPETMEHISEQDRASLMANNEGLLQSRHIVAIIEAMRQAGRLEQLTPE